MQGRSTYHPSKKVRRRELRTNGTTAEAVFWLMVKNKQLAGRRFRRQVDIGPYIVDFYCPAEQLVVELDGHHHFTQAGGQRDAHRDAWLLRQGLRVLRFENKLVLQDLEGVKAAVMECFRGPS